MNQTTATSATFTKVPVSPERLQSALADAELWAEHGYSQRSRDYWTAMRDTLRVMLGKTTEAPTMTGPEADIAALTILGPRSHA